MADARLVGALALLLAATGGDMATAQTPLPVVTVAGNGSAGGNARVRVGQELDIRLGANPTTGYTWRFQPDPPPVLQLTSRRFEPSSAHTPPPPGAGGIQVFAFKATAAGTVDLHFAYGRGETGPPARSFDLQVTVLP
jgi:predicted secreted protein